MSRSPIGPNPPLHPRFSRRCALQAGAIGLVGLGANHLQALRAAPIVGSGQGLAATGKARSAIYIFLSGGRGQHESFDMKPDAPSGTRGTFKPIEPNTSTLQTVQEPP